MAMSGEEVLDPYFRKTRFTLLWTKLLNEPFVALYALMPFILRKDLGASTFQISFFIMLKPMVSLFSFYWSARITQRRGHLRSNLIGAGILSFLPFLFFPWIDNVWLLVLLAALYMLFSRAGIPAWMEVLKLNLSKPSREKLFSLGLAMGCAEGILLGTFIGSLLDAHADAWKFLFLGSALLGLMSVFLQAQLPIRYDGKELTLEKPRASLPLLGPWKECFHLLKTHPSFAHWQWGTMASGFGIMLIIPAQALFFADLLHLSHQDLTIARCICFGVGFVLSSPFWSRAMGRFQMRHLTSLICLCFGLFPLLLLLSSLHLAWLYLAFLLYGITQAGSSLIWNLSGPFFAEKANSSPFSGLNILMIGIRGSIAPLLGGLLCDLLGPIPTLVLGALICSYGCWYMLAKKPCLFNHNPL